MGGLTLHRGSYHVDISADSALSANRVLTLPNASGTVSLEGHTHTSLTAVASIGSDSSSHATSLKTYFDSNKSTIPRNCFISFYDSTGSNGSITFGYFLNSYDSNPYGGFFSAHYNTAYYIGISSGTYTQWQLVKNDGGSWGISVTGSSASCTGNAATASALVDSNNSSKTITAQYSGSGKTSASWFCVWDGYSIQPMNAAYMRSSLGLNSTTPTTLSTTEAVIANDVSIYSGFFIYGNPSANYTACTFIPKSALSSTATSWQIADEANYVGFTLRIDGGKLYAKIAAGNYGSKTYKLAGLQGA